MSPIAHVAGRPLTAKWPRPRARSKCGEARISARPRTGCGAGSAARCCRRWPAHPSRTPERDGTPGTSARCISFHPWTRSRTGRRRLSSRAPDRPRHASRGWRRCADVARIRPGTDRRGRSWLRRQPELPVLHLREQDGDRAIEQDARITVRDLAAQERLATAELLARLVADGELDAIALGSGRLDRWTRSWACGGRSRGGRQCRRGGRRRGARRWRRQSAHEAPRIQLRGQRGDEDVGLFARPPFRLREDGLMVFRREMPPQQARGGQGHLPGSEQVEDHRESTAYSRRVYAIAGGVLGESKGLRAIRIERPVAAGRIDAWLLIEGREVGQELGERFALAAGERAEPGEEVLIGEGGGGRKDVRIHAPGVSRPFSESARASRTPPQRRSWTRSAARSDRDSLA